jgi:SET domain-containing protein 6
VLFTIPRTAIICTATSDLKDKIPGIFDLKRDDAGQSDSGDDDELTSSQQDSWTLLILAMIYEHQQGDASRWKPYLDVLPSTFDTPMFWSPTELSQLQASALVAKVGKEEADRMIQAKILSVVRAHNDIFFPPGSPTFDDNQLLQLAHRMGSTIMAYAFDLEKDEADDEGEGEEEEGWVEDREGKTMLGMVPMADILNADASFNAHINHGGDALTATALRPIRAGEEVLNYYGPLANGELLRRYGYVTPAHARYVVVELPWALVESELRDRVGGQVGAAEWEGVRQRVQGDEEFEESFVLERSSEDPDSTGQLESEAVFTGLPDELGEQFKTFLKAMKKVANVELAVQALSDKDTRKDLYLRTVLRALHAREKQYATTLEEDEQLANAGQPSGRERMALWVRRGEKQVLREAQAWVQKEIDEGRARASARTREDDGPAAKRRRM